MNHQTLSSMSWYKQDLSVECEPFIMYEYTSKRENITEL